MKLIPKEAWSYALLLIILCAIASIAVWQTIEFLHGRLPQAEFRIAAGALWSLTLGFMLIAGAFGLWATRFAAAAESRRRVSRLVETMNYIHDGLVAVDSRGRITGANPAAKALADREDIERQPIHAVFGCLSEKDVVLLANAKQPNEIERRVFRNATLRALRFRSQPSQSVSLVLISDVTSMNEQRARNRQAAQLQLIGELARGVAHDFNNLLCGISGHASLVSKLAPGQPELHSSINEITGASEKGIVLAGHLLELAKAMPQSTPSTLPAAHIESAAETLRNMLSERWSVKTAVDAVPTISLTGMQIEQVVLNLGLLAADVLGKPGILEVLAGEPGTHPLLRAKDDYACVVSISARETDAPVQEQTLSPAESLPNTGVIQSIIRSLVEEAGGKLEILCATDAPCVYRLCLPHGTGPLAPPDSTPFPDELAAYIAGWSVLLATPAREFSLLEARMRELDVKVKRIGGIVGLLAEVQDKQKYHALILDRQLLEQEAAGLLRAIIRLQPSAGVVVLCEDPAAEPSDLANDVSFMRYGTEPGQIMLAMVETRSVAVRRSSGQS